MFFHEKAFKESISIPDMVSSESRTCLAWKGLKHTSRCPYTRQQPSTKKPQGFADQLLVNRGSTAGQQLLKSLFRSSIGLNRISFVRPSEERSRTLFSICWKARGRVVSWPDQPDGFSSYPAPPPLAAPTRPAHGVPGFWIRQVIH